MSASATLIWQRLFLNSTRNSLADTRWVNVPVRSTILSWDLVAAVQTQGDIPDVMRTGTADMPTFIANNTVEDLTDYVKSVSWYAHLDPKAVEACTGPDGKIYCVPVSESPYSVYLLD